MGPLPGPLSPTEAQWIFTPLELEHTPSIANGVHPSVERNLRALAVRRLMQLKDAVSTYGPRTRFLYSSQLSSPDCDSPQIVAATAAAYVHRFYTRETFQDYEWPVRRVLARVYDAQS